MVNIYWKKDEWDAVVKRLAELTRENPAIAFVELIPRAMKETLPVDRWRTNVVASGGARTKLLRRVRAELEPSVGPTEAISVPPENVGTQRPVKPKRKSKSRGLLVHEIATDWRIPNSWQTIRRWLQATHEPLRVSSGGRVTHWPIDVRNEKDEFRAWVLAQPGRNQMRGRAAAKFLAKKPSTPPPAPASTPVAVFPYPGNGSPKVVSLVSEPPPRAVGNLFQAVQQILEELKEIRETLDSMGKASNEVAKRTEYLYQVWKPLEH